MRSTDSFPFVDPGVQGEEEKKKAVTWGMPTPYYLLLSTCGKLEGNNVEDQKLIKVED